MRIMKFYSFDLATKLDLDVVKMYVSIENEVPSFSGSKVIV